MAGPLRKRFLIPSLLFLSLAIAILGFYSLLPTAMDGTGQADFSMRPMILASDNPVGQTFSTQQVGLAGVDIFLAPHAPGDGKITLQLFTGPQAGQPIGEASLPLESVDAPGWQRFSFDPQDSPVATDHFVKLRVEGSGQVEVGTSSGDAYLDGSAYENGQPAMDAQLAFRTVYARGELVAGLLSQAGQWLVWLALAAVLFVLPGWVLLGSTWAEWPSAFWGERLGLATGLSLAMYPLLFLWTNLVGLQLGFGYAILPAGLALIWVGTRAVRAINDCKAFSPRAGLPSLKMGWADLALWIVIGLIFAVRFYIARPLSVPLWGDSYHHTLITQLLLDNKGLFQSWQPYADLNSLTYHFGFHSLAAVFAWASGLDAVQAVLRFGQILNGLAVLAIYPLVTRLSRNRWAGIAGLVVAGLLAPMPLAYINWGRYTQLAGQAILPAIIVLGLSTLNSEQKDKKILWAIGLAIGGLALTHYRVLILAVLFFIPALLIKSSIPIKSRFWKVAQTGLWGGLFFLPWFIHIYGGRILANFGGQLNTPASAVSSFIEQYNSVGSITEYLPMGLWLFMIAAMGWALWRRDRIAIVILGWLALVVLATNPAWFNLPGTGAISNFAILIASYIPAGIFCGAAVGWWVQKYLPERYTGVFSAALLVILVFAGAYGLRQQVNTVQARDFSLATRPDLRAAAWVRQNIAPDSTILVNSFPAYGGTTIAGSDGGWWLSYLSGRQTTLPPLVYGLESSPRPDFARSVNALTDLILDQDIHSAATMAELSRRGIGYIYIGQLQGRSGYGGPYPLEPAALLTDQHYAEIYHQDRVWVFKINP